MHEADEKTIMRYLGGLDPRYAHVVKLQQYNTFDEVCVLAYGVKQQKKSKPLKREFPKPLPKSQPFNKGSSFKPSKPVTQPLSPHKRTKLHEIDLAPAP